MSKNEEVLINPFGFREYDARWLYPKDINKAGIKNVGLGFGTQIISKTKKLHRRNKIILCIPYTLIHFFNQRNRHIKTVYF